MAHDHHHHAHDHHHHDHGHGDHGHGHGHAPAHERQALWAFLITALFMVVEAVGGYLSGSLALMADAAHMLADAAALAMAWAAFRLGRRQADPRRSYGYRRLEVLAAFVNGMAVLALSAWIVVEAVGRLRAPEPVAGATMLGIAAAGLVANLVVLFVLGHGHGHDNLNIKGAMVHVIGDLFGSVAAIAAAMVILWWGWTPIDPILSVLVAGLILYSAWGLVKSATHILLEGAPEGFDADGLARQLKHAVPALAEIHHIHAWSLTSGEPLVTLHARLSGGHGHDAALAAIKHELAAHHGITHSVIQVEGDAACPDKDCG